MRTEIKETDNKYYFTTYEEDKVRDGWWDKKMKEYSCTCIYASFYRYGQRFKDKLTVCKHAKQAKEQILKTVWG
jgi:hypothetical protein